MKLESWQVWYIHILFANHSHSFMLVTFPSGNGLFKQDKVTSVLCAGGINVIPETWLAFKYTIVIINVLIRFELHWAYKDITKSPKLQPTNIILLWIVLKYVSIDAVTLAPHRLYSMLHNNHYSSKSEELHVIRWLSSVFTLLLICFQTYFFLFFFFNISLILECFYSCVSQFILLTAFHVLMVLQK